MPTVQKHSPPKWQETHSALQNNNLETLTKKAKMNDLVAADI